MSETTTTEKTTDSTEIIKRSFKFGGLSPGTHITIIIDGKEVLSIEVKK
ncbi:MAG: hypothetical protein QW789_03525 [Nitrososphaerota archaeon]